MSALDNIPDSARLWIFQSNRSLSPDENQRIQQFMQEFLQDWNAHGSQLSAATEVRYDRFLIVAADEAVTQASGCSIDSMFRAVRSLGDELGVDFFDRTQIAYRNAPNQPIQTVLLSDFESIAKQLDAKNMVVFNNLIEVKGALADQWETSIDNSWHKNLL